MVGEKLQDCEMTIEDKLAKKFLKISSLVMSHIKVDVWASNKKKYDKKRSKVRDVYAWP